MNSIIVSRLECEEIAVKGGTTEVYVGPESKAYIRETGLKPYYIKRFVSPEQYSRAKNQMLEQIQADFPEARFAWGAITDWQSRKISYTIIFKKAVANV